MPTDSKNTSKKETATKKDPIEIAMEQAFKLWDDIKKKATEDPKFVEMPDNEKIAIYQKSEFKDFYVSQPIVCRYMICMGQFSGKAFKRYLLKCKSMEGVKVSIDKGVENPSEDRWIQRQADYIRYLWESYQRQHFNQSDAQEIWQQAYKTLSKEFKDFKDLHKNIEEKLKSEEKLNKSELVKELLNRITSEEQTLNDNTTTNLIEKLKDQLIQQRKKSLINQIKTDVELVI